LAFSPFHDYVYATVSDDCYTKIWQIPKEFPKTDAKGLGEENVLQNLSGHKRKVGTLEWNPVAENVLATAGADYDLKIWDVSTGTDQYTVSGHGGIIQSINWNYNGTQLVTYCKDKKMRFVDPRSNKITSETDSHTGVKGGRPLWMGKHEFVISCGVSKSPEREILVYDPRNLAHHVHRTGVDNANGLLQPYYDEDTDILFLSGKGDGSVKYYEIEIEQPANVMVHFLSQYSSNEPAATCGFLPKRGCDVNSNEIARVYKVTGQAQAQVMQPISFKVPRKSDLFQDDIFPDCRSDEPAQTKDDWFAGNNVSGPKTKSLQGGFKTSEKAAPEFSKHTETHEKSMSEEEMKKAFAELQKRVAFLEAEIIKKDAKIKELEAHH